MMKIWRLSGRNVGSFFGRSESQGMICQGVTKKGHSGKERPWGLRVIFCGNGSVVMQGFNDVDSGCTAGREERREERD